MNKKIMIVLVAMLGGVIGGFVLSSVIGAAGFLLFDQAIGIKYLPLILPFICAAIAIIIVRKK
ncbi:DUF5957 family protein [Paenibacillus eucommiae]|uniref:ABC-type antimicrobial peptide transport system permease subunit n=1 Tax=Paenibacillus eucommiae TaxID=1355755 RepID=A0ABS4IQD3_9BACL|nr:DUF5957 family protein [Paenibacillus eucommiae]MBP1989350.1 ABC-type antimicrobial peptide transport system permease subunit [Paenibacillus eucommiae]